MAANNAPKGKPFSITEGWKLFLQKAKTFPRPCIALMVLLLLAWGGFRLFAAPSLPLEAWRWAALSGEAVVTLLVVLLLFCETLRALDAVRSDRSFFVILLWTLYLFIFAALFFGLFKGYRISALGISSLSAGPEGTAGQSLLALMRFYPFHPMLPLHLAWAAGSFALIAQAGSFSSMIWGWTTLLAIFGWSTAWAVLFLVLRPFRCRKAFFFLLLTLLPWLNIWLQIKGLLGLPPIPLLHGYAVLLLCLQFLLLYRGVRRIVALRLQQRGVASTVLAKRLPPGAVVVFLFVFLFLPLFADLHNQGTLAFHTASASSLENSGGQARTVAAELLNVRSGPGVSFPVVGQLPNGQEVRVYETEGKWQRIGEGRWVSGNWLKDS
ncbi:MAG: SH3 domain-containing protein [Desulfovibrionaceae bacterium]